jgi:hypothetical protein
MRWTAFLHAAEGRSTHYPTMRTPAFPGRGGGFALRW